MKNRQDITAYNHHKQVWWATYRLYQIIFLHIVGITTIAVSIIVAVGIIWSFIA